MVIFLRGFCLSVYNKVYRFRYSQEVFTNEKTAGVSEYPLIASLIDGKTANVFCGATIIGKHHALTAASCMTGIDQYQISLLVGDHDMTSVGQCTFKY